MVEFCIILPFILDFMSDIWYNKYKNKEKGLIKMKGIYLKSLYGTPEALKNEFNYVEELKNIILTETLNTEEILEILNKYSKYTKWEVSIASKKVDTFKTTDVFGNTKIVKIEK